MNRRTELEKPERQTKGERNPRLKEKELNRGKVKNDSGRKTEGEGN